jgi:hypothetical protein
MDHFISLDQAIQMTTTFRENRDKILAPDYKGAEYLPNAETFDRAPFDEVLRQPGCTSLRIYYGMDAELKVHAIIVGVGENGEDILPSVNTSSATSTESSTSTTGTGIIEAGQRCPPGCSSSLLNP